MYEQRILEHYRNPCREGKLEDGIQGTASNPGCGDDTAVYLNIRKDEIRQIRHQTSACAIATASISLLADNIEGLEVDKVMRLDREWMLDLLGVDVSPMRIKCALLGLDAVQTTIQEANQC
ncbi:MAG: iron-sulfur cluster assembly scaffold protein [Candidatus Nanohaloarchaea archaeon]|nr:iron-sulfur cluster assembly scaffold protein [Candidatus Nanohaloarchaea archaeon]